MISKKLVQKHNRICLLLDYYGSLLTKRKQEILRLAYDEDMSLSEIADLLSITRQAVHDNMQRGVEQLETYETKLGMLDRDRLLIDKIQALLLEDKQSTSTSKNFREELADIQAMIQSSTVLVSGSRK